MTWDSTQNQPLKDLPQSIFSNLKDTLLFTLLSRKLKQNQEIYWKPRHLGEHVTSYLDHPKRQEIQSQPSQCPQVKVTIIKRQLIFCFCVSFSICVTAVQNQSDSKSNSPNKNSCPQTNQNAYITEVTQKCRCCLSYDEIRAG